MARGWKLKSVIQQKLQEVMEAEDIPVSPDERRFDDDIIITPEMLTETNKTRNTDNRTQPESEEEALARLVQQMNERHKSQQSAPSLADDDRQNWDDDPNFQEWMQAQRNIPFEIDESQIPPETDEPYYNSIPEEAWQTMPARPPLKDPPKPPDSSSPTLAFTPPNDPPKPPVHNIQQQGQYQKPPKDDPKKPAPKPSKSKKDDDIMIDVDMLEEKPTRQLYTVKEEFLEEVLKKAFERLDLPAINYINGSDILIETGGDAPADLIVVKPDGGELKVPLGEHEQTKLDDSVAEFEQMKGLDKE